MYRQIWKKSGKIIFDNIGIFILAGIVETVLIQVFLHTGTENLLLSALFSLLYTVANTGLCCFYFRAFNRGKPKIADIFAIFTENSSLAGLVSIVAIQYALTMILQLAVSAMAPMGSFMVLASTAVSVIAGSLIRMLPFLYISNPDYPTALYLKGLSKYLLPEVVRYVIFVFLTGVPLGLLLGIVMVFLIFLPIIGPLTMIFLLLMFRVFLSMSIAGFIASIIPDEWYAGARNF